MRVQIKTDATATEEATVLATEYLVGILPADSVNAWLWSLKVAYRGPGQYAVLHHGACLSRSGDWDHESVPSEREDEWITAHRFGLEEALSLAKQHAPGVTVNGLSATDLLARMRAGEVDE